MAAVGKGHGAQRIPDAKEAVGYGEAVQVILHVWDAPVCNAGPEGDGGVGDGHDGRAQRHQRQRVEVGALRAAYCLSISLTLDTLQAVRARTHLACM